MRRRGRGRRGILAAGTLLAALALAACDDQLKYIPIFSAMTEQPSVEAYEAGPRTPVAGTMPVDGERTFDLLAADTMLSNPLSPTAEAVARGAERFREFCTPCHGPQGRGDGPVVGPNRIPALPTLDLHTDRARGFSDGYLWGMITNGRGLMPSYRRVPPDDRWRIVRFVRELQAEGAGSAGGADEAGTSGAAATDDEPPDAGGGR